MSAPGKPEPCRSPCPEQGSLPCSALPRAASLSPWILDPGHLEVPHGQMAPGAERSMPCVLLHGAGRHRVSPEPVLLPVCSGREMCILQFVLTTERPPASSAVTMGPSAGSFSMRSLTSCAREQGLGLVPCPPQPTPEHRAAGMGGGTQRIQHGRGLVLTPNWGNRGTTLAKVAPNEHGEYTWVFPALFQTTCCPHSASCAQSTPTGTAQLHSALSPGRTAAASLHSRRRDA